MLAFEQSKGLSSAYCFVAPGGSMRLQKLLSRLLVLCLCFFSTTYLAVPQGPQGQNKPGPQTRPAPGGKPGGGGPPQGGNRPNPGGGGNPGQPGGGNRPGQPGGGGNNRPQPGKPNPGNGNRPQPGKPNPGNGNNRPQPGRPNPGGGNNRPQPGRPNPGGGRPPNRPSPGRPPQWGRPPANRPSYRFGNSRSYLLRYYARNLGYINRANRPHFAVGGFFPFAFIPFLTPVPVAIYGQVPPPPPGYAMGYYDGYVVVYDPATYFIADVVDLLD
jgi:hypothetical protein